MLLCGLKLTHDGGVAVIHDQRLVFSAEMEKLDGNRRYQPLDRLEIIEDVLRREGFHVGDIDGFVVDGWFPAPGEDAPLLRVTTEGRPATVETAPYCEPDALPWGDALRRHAFPHLPLPSGPVPYVSYQHATQHLLGTYCTSPFAARGEGAFVLVWDGGMTPRLYRVDTGPLRVMALGPLFPVYGSAFADYAAQFAPFLRPTGDMPEATAPTDNGHAVPPNLDVAGKAMAYAALGRDESDFHPVLDSELARLPLTFDTGTLLGGRIGRDRDELWPGASDADLIATFQGYLGVRLLSGLRDGLVRARARFGEVADTPNLCLAGGCALNIKWNSAIRASGLFREVWIPPFPNDSGAALGTAAVEMVHRGGTRLDWDVYQGPEIRSEPAPRGWRSEPCDTAGLARLLHEGGQPVVVLHGRAELGPRALGNRSILAPATDPKIKDVLNDIKDRESYRPVAPICLESRAPEIFSPGRPDPYMLFDHVVRPRWTERIPAVIHLDGTARLQTVRAEANAFLADVLADYERLSGVPVLCNTSANEKGRGFFPSVAAAAQWGRTDAIWCSGQLYTRQP